MSPIVLMVSFNHQSRYFGQLLSKLHILTCTYCLCCRVQCGVPTHAPHPSKNGPKMTGMAHISITSSYVFVSSILSDIKGGKKPPIKSVPFCDQASRFVTKCPVL